MADEEEPTQEENDEVIQELLNKVQGSQNQTTQLHGALAGMAGADNNPNLVQYQLESAELLDKLERFYKGEYIGIDDEGNQVWKKPKNEELIPLNEYGVNSMMEIVTKYIDKNTSLSYYSEDRIYEIMADIGVELTLILFCNYEKMGLDTYFKKTKFRILILTTLHVVESTYRRAIRGRTSDDINQSRIITQTDMVGNRAMMQRPAKKSFKFTDPSTWY